MTYNRLVLGCCSTTITGVRIILSGIVFMLVVLTSQAQPAVGTSGLLNIPTAKANPDGTFMFGGNYMPETLTPDYFDYNTGNYFFNVSFLPFLEISYNMTLLKLSNGTTNQDRSVSGRLYLLKEKQFTPALAAGMNDIAGNSFLRTAYIVATKQIQTNHVNFSVTSGIKTDDLDWQGVNGLFAGLAIEFTKLQGLRLIAEYDSNCINTGAIIELFNHLQLTAFAYDLKYLTGGIAYKIYLN